MQASQNTAQVFLGINLKCNALPRQLHQQVEAEGRVRARGLLLAGSEAAAVSLRRGAEPVRRARLPVSGDWPRPGVELARRSPRRGRGRSSRIRGTAGCRGRWSIASGSGCSAAASSPTPTKWMDGRGVRRCSISSRAISSIHGYDVKRLIETILTSRAYQMPAVPRTSEPSARDYVFAGPEMRRLTAEQFADAVGAITGEWNVYSRTASGDARRRLRARMAGGVQQPHARARPSDSRSGEFHARDAGVDAAGARARERRDATRDGCRAARGGCSASCRRNP